MVMYTRVNGNIDLYFVSVSETADFCTSSFFVPRTLALPVAVFDSFDVLYSEAVLPPFFLREAPPRISSIELSALFELLIVVAVAGAVVDVDSRDVKVIRLGWNDVDASTL